LMWCGSQRSVGTGASRSCETFTRSRRHQDGRGRQAQDRDSATAEAFEPSRLSSCRCGWERGRDRLGSGRGQLGPRDAAGATERRGGWLKRANRKQARHVRNIEQGSKCRAIWTIESLLTASIPVTGFASHAERSQGFMNETRDSGRATRQHSAMSRKPVPSPGSWLAAGTPMISSAVTPTTPETVTAEALSASRWRRAWPSPPRRPRPTPRRRPD
jgi:hypothetical protein